MKISFEGNDIGELAYAMQKFGAGYRRVVLADEELKRLITENPPQRKEKEDDPNHDHC